MSKPYAVIKDGIVVNTVVWDGENKWSPGPDMIVQDISKNPEVAIGDIHKGDDVFEKSELKKEKSDLDKLRDELLAEIKDTKEELMIKIDKASDPAPIEAN